MSRKDEIMAEIRELNGQIQGYDVQISVYNKEIHDLENRINWLNSQVCVFEEKAAGARDRIYQLNQISFCDNCGNEVSAEDLFCQYCGSRILKHMNNISEDACPQCGAFVEPGSRFCTQCGFRLSEGGQSAPALNNPMQESARVQPANASEPEKDSQTVAEQSEESLERPEFSSIGSRVKGEGSEEPSIKDIVQSGEYEKDNSAADPEEMQESLEEQGSQEEHTPLEYDSDENEVGEEEDSEKAEAGEEEDSVEAEAKEEGISTFSYEVVGEETDSLPQTKVNLSKESGSLEKGEEETASSPAGIDTEQGEPAQKEEIGGDIFGGFGSAFVSNRFSQDEIRENKQNGFMGGSGGFGENKADKQDDLNRTMYIPGSWDFGKDEDDLNKTMYIKEPQNNKPEAPIICPFCGEVLEEESIFCYMCGKKLK